MRCGGEAAHVGADLGDQDLSGAPTHPGDGVQVGDGRLERTDPLGDLAADVLDGLVEEGQVGQLLGQQEPLVRGDPAGERPHQLGDLGAEPAAGQFGQHRRVGVASDQPVGASAGRRRPARCWPRRRA